MHPLLFFLYGIWTIALYVLPTAIAFSRKKKHRWIIAIINILGGWIYGVPWLVSLVWALLGLKTDGSKGFKAWPVCLGLVVAPLLLGALGATINPPWTMSALWLVRRLPSTSLSDAGQYGTAKP